MIIEDKGLAALNEFGIFYPQKSIADSFQESDNESVQKYVEKQSSDSNSSEIEFELFSKELQNPDRATDVAHHEKSFEINKNAYFDVHIKKHSKIQKVQVRKTKKNIKFVKEVLENNLNL